MRCFDLMRSASISAALYTSLPPSDHVRTLDAIAPKALFAEDAKTMRSMRSAGIEVPLWILLTGEADGAMSLEKLRERGRAAMSDGPAGLTSARRSALAIFLTSPRVSRRSRSASSGR